jgi:CheY-like chemotaxis protein
VNAAARALVLILDDEERILKVLSRALREDGHDVVATASPREAQRLLAERTFDVFLVDNLMPEKSGLEVIRELVGGEPGGVWGGRIPPDSRGAAE